jgi:hypothetical protein
MHRTANSNFKERREPLTFLDVLRRGTQLLCLTTSFITEFDAEAIGRETHSRVTTHNSTSVLTTSHQERASHQPNSLGVYATFAAMTATATKTPKTSPVGAGAKLATAKAPAAKTIGQNGVVG